MFYFKKRASGSEIPKHQLKQENRLKKLDWKNRKKQEMSTPKPVTPPTAPQQQKAKTPELAAETPTSSSTNQPPAANTYRLQPEDLDVTRNNEATNDFQAKTIELRNQRPQWITYYQ